MWMLCVWWVLLGTLGAGSAQLSFAKIPFLEMNNCNGPKIILPCVVTDLKENSSRAMYVSWQFQGNTFFTFDGVHDNITKNNTFNTANFLNRSMVPYGIVSLSVSTKQALLGNYTCEVTEGNREGKTRVELRESSDNHNLKSGTHRHHQTLGFIPGDALPGLYCNCLQFLLILGAFFSLQFCLQQLKCMLILIFRDIDTS